MRISKGGGGCGGRVAYGLSQTQKEKILNGSGDVRCAATEQMERLRGVEKRLEYFKSFSLIDYSGLH